MTSRALGEANQYPVTRFGSKPGPQFLLSFVVESERHLGLARLCCRLEFDERDTVCTNAVGRFAAANLDDLILSIVFHFPPRPVRCIDAERANSACTCWLPGSIVQSNCDQRTRVAIGNQHGHVGNNLAANRGAGIVNRSFDDPRDTAVRIGHFNSNFIRPILQVHALPARDCNRACLVGDQSVKIQCIDRTPIQHYVDSLLHAMLDGDLGRRNCRLEILGGQ